MKQVNRKFHPEVLCIVASWNFLTNHALVLAHVTRLPESTGLEIAVAVGITERAARRILADLQAAGYLESEKNGRRNRYRVNTRLPLRPIGQRELTIGRLLDILQAQAPEPEDAGHESQARAG